MLKRDALQFFGGDHTAVAKAAGVTRSAVWQWGDRVPLLSAMRLQESTKKQLRVDLRDYKREAA